VSDRLQGKTALVTEASRGIGRAIGIGLSAHGARVVVNYLKNEAQAAEVVDAISFSPSSDTMWPGRLAAIVRGSRLEYSVGSMNRRRFSRSMRRRRPSTDTGTLARGRRSPSSGLFAGSVAAFDRLSREAGVHESVHNNGTG
jgi:short chain dehydrogenase